MPTTAIPARTSGTTARRIPWEFKRVWHLEPSLTDPDTVHAGVEDAALFRSSDGGQSWQELPALRSVSGSKWCTRRRRHGTAHDPLRSEATRNASSSPSRPPAASAPTMPAQTWKAINQGLRSEHIPDPTAEVGHCVHRIAMHPSRPNVLFMQKHWDVMRSDDAGDTWHEISGNLPTDFGFPIEVHAHEPNTVYVVPIKSDSEHYPPEGKLRVYRSRSGGNEWEALTDGLPQSNCYVNVLRDAMSIDTARSVRHLLRHDGRPGVSLAGRGRSLVADRARPAGGGVGRGADAAMIRVVLPYHLRTLAKVGAEVELEVPQPGDAGPGAGRAGVPLSQCCAARSAITAARRRRPMLRFFACEQDLSNEAAGRAAARRGRVRKGGVLDRGCSGRGIGHSPSRGLSRHVLSAR